MEYQSKNHSNFLLMAHLIFVCKYRKKLLIPLGKEVKSILEETARKNDIEIIEMEGDKDHIHLLISYEPKRSILEIVRLLKQTTTFHLWKTQAKVAYEIFLEEEGILE